MNWRRRDSVTDDGRSTQGPCEEGARMASRSWLSSQRLVCLAGNNGSAMFGYDGKLPRCSSYRCPSRRSAAPQFRLQLRSMRGPSSLSIMFLSITLMGNNSTRQAAESSNATLPFCRAEGANVGCRHVGRHVVRLPLRPARSKWMCSGKWLLTAWAALVLGCGSDSTRLGPAADGSAGASDTSVGHDSSVSEADSPDGATGAGATDAGIVDSAGSADSGADAE